MKYKIVSWNKHSNSFQCSDENGKNHYIDLFISGKLKGFGRLRRLTEIRYEAKMNSLIGKFVEINYLIPYLKLASNAELLK